MRAAMIADTVSAASSIRIVEREHRPARRGPRHELEQDLGDDAERAFGADEQILQRVAGHVLHALVAEARDLAVGSTTSSPIT